MSKNPEEKAKKRQDDVIHGFSLMSKDDLYLFNEGSHFRLYEKLGAHPLIHQDIEGAQFALWAPNAEGVFVMGDFNGWDKGSHGDTR